MKTKLRMKSRNGIMTFRALIAGVLLLGNLHARAQEMPQSGVVATGAYIEVSDSLYKSIKDWLLFGKDEQKLDDFLLSHYYNEREVLDFLGAYYSGAYSGNTNKTTTTEPCVCNVIRPATVGVDASTPTGGGQTTWTKVNLGLQTYEEYQDFDGMFKSAGLKISGSQGTHQIRQAQSFLKVEMLNLCTAAGLPQTECNCNKPVRVSGMYHRWFDVDGGTSSSAWCSLCPHGREGQFSDAFYVTNFDLIPNNQIWVVPDISVTHSDIFSDEF